MPAMPEKANSTTDDPFIAQLQAMYNNCISTLKTEDLRKREENRLLTYKSSLSSDKVDFGWEKNKNTAEGYPLGERKRKNCGDPDSMTEKSIKRLKVENPSYGENHYANIVLDSFQDKSRCASIMKSIDEIHQFNSCYQTNPNVSLDVTKELMSLEHVYDAFNDFYASPYAKDNPVEESSLEISNGFTRTMMENY